MMQGYLPPLLSLKKYVFVQWITSVASNVSQLLQETGAVWVPLICMPSRSNSGLLCRHNCSLTSILAKGVGASCLSWHNILDKHFSDFKPGCYQCIDSFKLNALVATERLARVSCFGLLSRIWKELSKAQNHHLLFQTGKRNKCRD